MLSVIHLITFAFKKLIMAVLNKLILSVAMIDYGYFNLYIPLQYHIISNVLYY